MSDELPPPLAALIAGEREAPTGDRNRVRAARSLARDRGSGIERRGRDRRDRRVGHRGQARRDLRAGDRRDRRRCRAGTSPGGGLQQRPSAESVLRRTNRSPRGVVGGRYQLGSDPAAIGFGFGSTSPSPSARGTPPAPGAPPARIAARPSSVPSSPTRRSPSPGTATRADRASRPRPPPATPPTTSARSSRARGRRSSRNDLADALALLNRDARHHPPAAHRRARRTPHRYPAPSRPHHRR